MSRERVKLRFTSGAEALDFVACLRTQEDSFAIENGSGQRRINAKSLMGVLTLLPHLNEGLFLVNETHAGRIPACIGSYVCMSI